MIVVLTIVLQISFFSYLSFFGTTPNVVPLVVVSLGLLGGGMVGAVCGFTGGLLLDSALLQTLGVSSLVLLSAGYLAGRYREGAEISNSLIPPLLAGALTTGAAAGFAAIQLMLGVRTPVSLLVLREIFVQGLLAVLLMIPIYPLIRRVLRPAIVDDVVVSGARTPLDPGRDAATPHPSWAADAARGGGLGPVMFGERERPLMPAQFALRVAILSGFALVMFSIIFFRLWYLQVLSGDKYLKQAKNNQVREVTVQAPRGQILDRNGHVLVDNRTALALQLQPDRAAALAPQAQAGVRAPGARWSACRPTGSPSSSTSRPRTCRRTR